MVKKAISIYMAFMLALLLSGCKPLSNKIPRLDPNNPVAITIWHYYSGVQKNAFDKMVAEFNDSAGREKGIIVESISQGGVSELAKKLMAAALGEPGAGDMPDVFGAYSDTVYDLDALGMVASLDNYLSEAEINEYVEGFISEARSLPGGDLKIFPIAKSTEILSVNKTDWDKFVKAVTEEDVNNRYEDISVKRLSTWEGIYKAAETYYRWTDDLTPDIPHDGQPIFGIDSVANFQIIANKQLGVNIISTADGKPTINISRDAQKRIWDFYYKGIVNGYFGAIGRFRSDDMKMGNILMYVGSSSAGAYLPTQVTLANGDTYDIESMILPMPVFQGSRMEAIQQGAGMAVKKSTPEKEYAAVVFLRYFTETKRNIEFAFDSSYLPVKKSTIESKDIMDRISSLKTSSEVQNNNIAAALEVSLKQMKDYNLYSAPPFAGSFDVREAIESITSSIASEAKKKVEDYIKDGMPAEDAIAQLTNDSMFDDYILKLTEGIEKQIR